MKIGLNGKTYVLSQWKHNDSCEGCAFANHADLCYESEKIIDCKDMIFKEVTLEKISESKQRPHAELIKAWADGAEIQYFDIVDEEWVDCTLPPAWDDFTLYRVKPEEKKPVVRWLWAIKTTGYDKDGEELVTWVTRRVFKTEKEWDDELPSENRVKLEWTRTEFPE